MLIDAGSDPSRANALRRALINSVPVVAPSHIVVRKNTSSFTDEFLAHRIGMIPFTQANDKEIIDVCASSCVVRSGDLHSAKDDVPSATHDDVVVVNLKDGEEFDASIHFKTATAREHARFSHIVAAGMEPKNGRFVVSFETMIPGDEMRSALIALDVLLASLNRTMQVVTAYQNDATEGSGSAQCTNIER